MSRLGRKEIIIPEGVKVELKDHVVFILGPKGQLEFKLVRGIEVETAEGKIKVLAKNQLLGAMQGTTRQILANMITGVNSGWSKTLEVIGTGYKAILEGGTLVFSLGFSHKIRFDPPEGITFSVVENKVTVSGVDKCLVGKIAAQIKELKKPDAYKGKGIRYQGERIRLKPGKATKVGGAK
ncbi:MAG: 50S ribosomal protein L6 [Candidatus Curtissbacteria bacterium]|nr:50S ribosomal protein L6 [bacterium]MDZ4209845.1 50S ribosomal protein L6 [Candidatus Curtissbacteria bacterium]